MQALSSEYAVAYGGYGRPGAYGGYGGRLRKPESPSSGLAAQSLSDSQVSEPFAASQPASANELPQLFCCTFESPAIKTAI